MVFLRENTAKPKEKADVVRPPNTIPLIILFGEFTPESARKMNEFIAKVLVDVAVALRSLPEGNEYDEYIKTLNFNIHRLNLNW